MQYTRMFILKFYDSMAKYIYHILCPLVKITRSLKLMSATCVKLVKGGERCAQLHIIVLFYIHI